MHGEKECARAQGAEQHRGGAAYGGPFLPAAQPKQAAGLPGDQAGGRPRHFDRHGPLYAPAELDFLKNATHVRQQGGIGRKAHCRIRFQHARNQRNSGRVQVRAELPDVRGGPVQARQHHVNRGRAFKRRPPRQHVKQRGAKAVNVGAKIHFLAAGFFRRHVVGRAHYRPISLVLRFAEKFRQSEIHHLRLAARAEKNVLGLHVAVDQPELARRLQTLGHIYVRLEGAHLVKLPASGYLVVQPPLAHKLHHNVRLQPLILVEVVYLHHVRVVQLGGRLGLTAELLKIFVMPEVLHHLQGYKPAQLLIVCSIYHAHPAGPQPLQQDKRPESRRYPLVRVAVRTVEFRERGQTGYIKLLVAGNTIDLVHPVNNHAALGIHVPTPKRL